VFVGDPQYTVGGGAQNSRYNLFVPRVGLVWDPKGDGKMTIRAPTECSPTASTCFI
jgi:hypothetical protein